MPLHTVKKTKHRDAASKSKKSILPSLSRNLFLSGGSVFPQEYSCEAKGGIVENSIHHWEKQQKHIQCREWAEHLFVGINISKGQQSKIQNEH